MNSEPSHLPLFPYYFFLLANFICFFDSANFHTFGCISKKYWDILLRLDYASICFILTGSCYPIYYYCFYCDSFYFNLYIYF